MKSAAAIERMERVVAIRASVENGTVIVADLEAGLADVRDVRAFLDAAEAAMVSALKPAVSFPESAIANTSRGSIGAASKTLERADTLEATPELAAALDAAAITSGHVDAVTRATKGLDGSQREQLLNTAEELVGVAVTGTVEQFSKRLRLERKTLLANDGMDRLEQQRRMTSMRTWVDDDGMWNVRGRFDPLNGVRLAARLDKTIETLFAEAVPEFCPSDPVDKQGFLRAHAFLRLCDGGAAGPVRSGRAEFVVVIDADAAQSVGPVAAWPIAVEVPDRVLAELAADAEKADVVGVVVRNGVVLHAPGTLNLGRSTRLANRAQRRALRGLYSGCAIPGCGVHSDRCKLHHIVWWRHGGATDLDNLLPVCSRHHHNIHDDNWQIELGPNRELTIRFPDGTIHNTGPPSRKAA
jgi:hypothetical protein